MLTVLRHLLTLGCFGLAVLALTIPAEPVPINVRWQPGLSGAEREAREAEFDLRARRHLGDSTWSYELFEYSRENIRAIVRHPGVADTHYVDRSTFTPDDPPPDRRVRVVGGAALFAAAGSIALIALAAMVNVRRFWLSIAAVAAAFAALRLLPVDTPERALAAAPWLPVLGMLVVGTTAALDRRIEITRGSLAVVLIAPPAFLAIAAMVMFAAASGR